MKNLGIPASACRSVQGDKAQVTGWPTICDICGKERARVRHITGSYGKGETLLVIDGVPVVSCPHCGASYLAADTQHEIERIKLQRQKMGVTRPVAVAEFL